MREVPHRLVFIDETAVKTNLTRLHGRAPVGERLYGAAPFGKWGTQTFIAGLTRSSTSSCSHLRTRRSLLVVHLSLRTQSAHAPDQYDLIALPSC